MSRYEEENGLQLDSSTTLSTLNVHEMDSSNDNNFDQEVLKIVGEHSISTEWSATTSALNSSGTTISNSDIHIGTLKECCANPSDSLKYKEDFMVLESTSTAVNITNFNADDTKFLSTPKAAFQKKHRPYPHNFSHAFENIIDNDSLTDITQSSICLNRFQKRPQFILPDEEDFVEINKSDNSGVDSVSIKSPKFGFLKKNRNRSSLNIPDYNLSTSSTASIIDDTSLPKIKENIIFKKPSEFNKNDEISMFADTDELLSNSKSIRRSNRSFKKQDIDEGSSLKKSNNTKDKLDLKNSSKGSSSMNEPIKENSLELPNVAIDDKLHECNNLFNPEDSNSESMSNKTAGLLKNNYSSNYRVTEPMSKSMLAPVDASLSIEPHQSSSSSKHSTSDTSTNVSKPIKFINYKKTAAQSAVFENLITNSQESNLSITPKKMLSNSGLKNQSKIQNDEISMFENTDEVLSNSLSIRRSNHSFKNQNIGEGSSLKKSNSTKDKLDLKKFSKGLLLLSSMNESIKENRLEVANVAIDDKLHEHNNSFNPEDNYNESMSNITAGLLENNNSSNDRVTRSRSNSLLAPIDASLSVEPNQSLSSSKHSTSGTSINISKPIKFINYKKTAAQSAVFENLITNSEESNLSITPNNMLSNSGLKDQSRIKNDEISMFADSDELLSNSISIRRSNHSFKLNDISKRSSLKKLNNTKDELDLKNSSKGSNSMNESIKENSLEVANVAIDDKLQVCHNSFNPEDNYSESMSNITAGLLENNNSSNDRVTRSRSNSLLTPVDAGLSFEPNQSLSSSNHSTSGTCINVSKPIKFINYKKTAAQSAVFENLITNSQESNLSITQKKMLNNSGLKNQSINKNDEISMFENTDEVLSNSLSIRCSNRSFKNQNICEELSLKKSNNTNDKLDLKNSSKGSSSMNESIKENHLEVANVAIDDKLHEHNNSFNPEDNYNESMSNITAGLLENNNSSNDRVTRSRSNSLLAPVDAGLSFELNQSLSSSKHSTSGTSINISKPIKFLNHKKTAAQSAVFENLITNSEESNLSITPNKMLSNSSLKDQSRIQNDEISMFADSDELLSNSISIRRSNRSFKRNDISKRSSLKKLNNTKDELDLKNSSKGSCSMNESIKENSLEVANVAIDDKLQELNNSFNPEDPEDNYSESMSNITAGLLENNNSSNDRVTRSRSNSLLAPVDASLSIEPNQSSSSSINISKSIKFQNYQKTAAQSAVFENLLTNSQESNLTKKDQSKIQNDEVSMFANIDEVLSNSKSIRRSNRSFKRSDINKRSSLKKLNNTNDELDLKNSSKGSSSMNESIKENIIEVTKVSIANKLHKQNNSFNPEDNYSESMPNMTAGLLDNNNSSTDRVTRSRSKSLLVPVDTGLSFEPNQSSSSSKHSISDTSLNFSKPIKFLNYKKTAAQSAVFENLITNSQESNLIVTQNKVLSNSGLKNPSKIHNDEITMFENTDEVLSNIKSIGHSDCFKKPDIGEGSDLKMFTDPKDKLDLKNLNGSSSMNESIKENNLEVAKVAIDDIIHEHNNSFNLDDNYSDSMSNITAGLLENNNSSNDRVTRSRSKSLLAPVDTSLSFKPNQSSSSKDLTKSSGSTKHSSNITPNNKTLVLVSTTIGPSKQKRKSFENDEQITSNNRLLKKIKSTTQVARPSSVSVNTNNSSLNNTIDSQSLISENNNNYTSTSSHKASKTEVHSINKKFNNSLFHKSLSMNPVNKSTVNNITVNQFLTPTTNKKTIAENIVKTIVKMSVNKRKSIHPGVFQFENVTKKRKTFSLDQSNSFLTRFLAGNKINEPESTLSALSYSETIIDQLQIKENIANNFKSLYKKEPWITNRLYGFLINKLLPRYSVYAVKHAEHFVKYLASRLKDILYDKLDLELCSDMLRYHMARFEIINTTFDYLDFLSNYIPAQYFKKLVPESFDEKFDSKKYFLPIMDDEEFLLKVITHLNTN